MPYSGTFEGQVGDFGAEENLATYGAMTLICPHNRPIGQLANDLERVPEELAWSIKATNDAYE